MLCAAPGLAQDKAPALCPDKEDPIPRGLLLSTSLGPALWLGEVGADSKLGMLSHFSLGWEFLPYLGLEATWSSGFNDTDQPHPPADGSFSTHALQARIRLNLPLDRFDLFAHGGVGMMWARPDILVRVDGFNSDLHLAWSADLGFAWHSSRKRIWLGAQAGVLGGVDFPGYLLNLSAVIGLSLDLF